MHKINTKKSSVSTSNRYIQNDTKSKKAFRNIKNKSNYHNEKSIDTNQEEISVKSSICEKEKLENFNINQRNKGNSFLKETSKEQDLKNLSKEPFITTLQDFPELKVNKDSSPSKFGAENKSITHHKSWGTRQKKFEGMKIDEKEGNSYSSVINDLKNKTDSFIGKSKSNKDTGNNLEGFGDTNEKECKTNLNIGGSKEKETISVKEAFIKPITNSKKKKRSDPVLINLHDILNINKLNKHRKNSQKLLKSKFQRHKVTEQLSGNCLDSSNPKRLRGKHREVKKKTLSNLKLTIIKGRIIKQKLREKSIADYFVNENVNFIDNIDFKTEIKIYLQKLSERKLKESQPIQNEVKISCTNGNANKEINAHEKNKKIDKIIPSITPEGNFKFSSKFREYCDNIITPNLNSAVSNLIKETVNLQDKSFLRDPIKARARKRHVSGIREVKKYLNLKKAKLIIIAPNLEKLQIEGSLHDVINDLKSTAQAQNIPYAFALDRYKLGRYTKKNLPVSAIAILIFEGLEELFYNVLDLLQEAKTQFNEMMKMNSKMEENIKTSEVNSKLIASFISAFKTDLEISDEKQD